MTPSSVSSATRTHEADLVADGVDPAVLDLETRAVDDVAAVVAGADAVVFAAGGRAGQRRPPARTPSTARPPSCSPTPPSGPAVRAYLLVSSMGVESVADGRRPRAWTTVFVAYLRPSCAAEDGVLARAGAAT